MEAKLMNCEHASEMMVDWLNNQMPASERAAFEVHLNECPDCQRELKATRQLWDVMGSVAVPKPSDNLPIQFYTMLETFKGTETKKVKKTAFWEGLKHNLESFFTPKLLLRVSYSMCLLLIGLGGGYFLSKQQTPDYQVQIEKLSGQVQEMNEKMMLTLLEKENSSATERLQAVSYTKEIDKIDGQVLEALLSTLNNDENVNVRLVTLEALAQLADNPKVREGLVQSILKQDTPLVQAALADVMVKLEEKRSIKPLQRLLEKDDTDVIVKTKIKETLKALSYRV
ncbi:HEAT repeat domain-containing protein [Emticicia sp. C21]|uniref:HEAT repeat domain-containing protein n=1 Tax=Emticicia sp. C21 TaxID=2302915 RepID=UPI000E34CCB4|nr:HEAT repeat domain-containing protein [Emticicia sp. C21]RFS14380.1 HEAT repeat domain-containing protein [Emticicia sp. C21]